MVEYRPLDGDEHEVFVEYTSYAFQPSAGPEEFDPDDPDTERILMGDLRGLFPDDAGPDEPPLSVCSHFWFDALVRGEYHPAPGLSTVATPPEHRRQGYIEDLLVAALEEYRSRSDRFSLLWPFRYQFYRQFGWGPCSSHHSYSLDPEDLSFARAELDDPGRFRQVEVDEYPVVERVYDEFTDGYPLAITRDEEWWRKRVFTAWRTDPFVYVWKRDGAARAYLAFVVDTEGEERTLAVRDLAFVDHESLLAVCAFLANHDSQVTEVTLSVPPDVDLLAMVREPRDVECEREFGAMARIVDVAETLAAIDYPNTTDSITLAVTDPLVDWNTGRFRLEVRDGAASCDVIGNAGDDVGDVGDDGDIGDVDTGADAGADAKLGIAHLTQLVVGFRSATELERRGRLSASADALATLERLYPPAQPALLTGF